MVWSVLPRPCGHGGLSAETTYKKVNFKAHHFVSKDAVQTVVMQGDHPIQPLELIVTHLSIDV